MDRPGAMLVPPPLEPGDTVAVVAPASPFEPVLAWVGMGWLAKRYRIRFDRGLFARTGYLAGDDDRRRTELVRALEDPSVKAIIAARGGYGALRFTPSIDWRILASRPRWIVGFSDITALHVEASRAGVASIHGPHITSLGRGDARARDAFLRILEHPFALRVHRDLPVLSAGCAEGILFGGNLTLLHACAAAGHLSIPEGAVLLIEDVTERPYRIDRMLASLAAGGHLARASAVLLGEFVQCEPGPDRVPVERVLADHLTRLGVPVVAGLPVGHGLRNDPVVLGLPARVEASSGVATVTLGGA
ncbi:MAG: LD-carboxypeptidase [Polyangiaceae bacterium]|nr:LD-carboxypeptidase [Polyangiaceae bacterium]